MQRNEVVVWKAIVIWETIIYKCLEINCWLEKVNQWFENKSVKKVIKECSLINNFTRKIKFVKANSLQQKLN